MAMGSNWRCSIGLANSVRAATSISSTCRRNGVVAAAAGYQQSDWSEVTPGDYCDEECCVGGHDLREEFFHYVGQHCVLVASTRPIDVAEFEGEVG